MPKNIYKLKKLSYSEFLIKAVCAICAGCFVIGACCGARRVVTQHMHHGIPWASCSLV